MQMGVQNRNFLAKSIMVKEGLTHKEEEERSSWHCQGRIHKDRVKSKWVSAKWIETVRKRWENGDRVVGTSAVVWEVVCKGRWECQQKNQAHLRNDLGREEWVAISNMLHFNVWSNIWAQTCSKFTESAFSSIKKKKKIPTHRQMRTYSKTFSKWHLSLIDLLRYFF